MAGTPVCTVDSTGIHRPTLATILAWIKAQFTAIYGSDIAIDSSDFDGEWLGLLSSAIDDTNAMCVQAYNAFSPATSQGAGLSSVVKINGLQRKIPSYSTAPMLVIGRSGTTVVAGLVDDDDGFQWALPTPITIPPAGQIAVTATCTTLGAIAAPAGAITTIANTQPGWQAAHNTAAATLGAPVETDPQLRIRQSESTMNGSTAIVDGIEGGLLAIAGVVRAVVYSNETDLPDENEIPGHCIAAVVDGGLGSAIAALLYAKKGGCGTYGSTNVIVTDAFGIPHRVAYFPVATPAITVAAEINQLSTFTTDVIALVQTSIAAYIGGLPIGAPIQFNRLYAAAYLYGAPAGQTFEIVSLTIGRDGATPTAEDVPMGFFEAPACLAANVLVTVLN